MNSLDTITSFFKAFSDPNRIRIINLLLTTGELCVCDIQRVLNIPQARVSRHLTVLRTSGIVTVKRQGLWMYYRIAQTDMRLTAVLSEIRILSQHTPILKEDESRLCCVKDVAGTAQDSPRARLKKRKHRS